MAVVVVMFVVGVYVGVAVGAVNVIMLVVAFMSVVCAVGTGQVLAQTDELGVLMGVAIGVTVVAALFVVRVCSVAVAMAADVIVRVAVELLTNAHAMSRTPAM